MGGMIGRGYSEIENRAGRARQPLPLALNESQSTGKVYAEWVNDGVQVAREYPLIVWFRGLKERDQDHEDLERRRTRNR